MIDKEEKQEYYITNGKELNERKKDEKLKKMKENYSHFWKLSKQILKKLENGLSSKENDSLTYLLPQNEEEETESIYKNIHYFNLQKDNDIVLNEHIDLGIISLIPISTTPGLFVFNRFQKIKKI